jgi:hypothetical protein
MLSFLYRLIRDFQREHGLPHNVLHLNETHYHALRENLSQLGHEETERFLQLHIVLFREEMHPRVACQKPLRRRAAGDA